MKRPLAGLTVFFCSGIVVASRIKINFWLIYVLALIFLLFGFLTFQRKPLFHISLLCLSLFLGAALFKNTQYLPACHVSKFVSYRNNNLYTLRGVIVNEPSTRNNKTAFVFRVEEIQLHNLKHNCCGDSLVYIKGKKDLVYGEELILIGDLRRPFSYKDKRKNSWRNYLNNQNIYSILWVKNISQAIRLNRKKTFMLKGFSLRLKEKMERIIFKYLPGVPASVLDAMVLGEKRNIPPFISDTMMKAGTVHILVVSGFNVGIVIFAISLFLKLIRIPRRGRFAITIPLLIIYCLMTGASNPVVRATVMGIIFMLAHWLQREPDIYNSSAIAALFILLYNPRQLFDVGFQLSFASVLSIVYFYPKIKSFLRINSLKIKYLRYIIEGCLISFSAWLGTMGFIAYYFKIFSPITVLANVFIVPLASLITLCGFGLIILGLTWPLPAFLFAKATEFLVVVLLYLNTFLIKLPGAYLYLS